MAKDKRTWKDIEALMAKIKPEAKQKMSRTSFLKIHKMTKEHFLSVKKPGFSWCRQIQGHDFEKYEKNRKARKAKATAKRQPSTPKYEPVPIEEDKPNVCVAFVGSPEAVAEAVRKAMQ